MPFSGEALEAIKRRSKGRSEISGKTDRPLHCIHKNHDKKRPDYNTEENGIRGTVVEHLAFHLLFRGDAKRIGLKECQNDYAIDMLNREAVEFFHRIGKLNIYDQELEDSMVLVSDYLADQ